MDRVLDIPAIERFGIETGVFALMNTAWGWPVAEIIHFVGLCLLLGTVGLYDLRMMGLVRGLELSTLHRLVPFGVAGWVMCVTTGVLFVLTAPGQYLYNPAFQTKMGLMALAGLNMGVFYLTTTAKAVEKLQPDDLPPIPARIVAIVSLGCWLGVVIAGRVITFYRPPYHWCFWCGT